MSWKNNGTWVISESPTGNRAVGCRRIFTFEYNMMLTSIFRARFVAKGFTESYGIEYHQDN